MVLKRHEKNLVDVKMVYLLVRGSFWQTAREKKEFDYYKKRLICVLHREKSLLLTVT